MTQKKSQDKEEQPKRRRGGQPGNQNARGHGAPRGNTNAETHGAYSRTRWERLTPEQRAEIEALTMDFQSNAEYMLKKLQAKRTDLEQRITALQDVEDDTLYLDRVTTMQTPEGEKINEYANKSTAFSRRMILEAELNRLDGRILKLVDSIKSAKAEQERLDIERERLRFYKQRAAGVFNVDENGEIIAADEEDEIIYDL